MIGAAIFWGSALLLFLTWVGYPLAVIALARFVREQTPKAPLGESPSLSVVVAAYNEEKKIGDRIRSLLVEAPNALEIIIGCDGCTDKTAEVSRAFGGKVRVLEFPTNRGRALVHNDCIAQARGEVVLFTDAETRLGEGCVDRLMAAFSNPRVGGVSGRIVYVNADASPIGRSASAYWKFEEKLRVAESKIGILAFGTGAVLALRKNLYKPIRPTEDVDYAATLDIALEGFRILYEPRALAFDFISETLSGAARTRERQTSRSFASIARRLLTRRALCRPGIWIGAVFHKSLRHLTFALLAGCFVGNLMSLGLCKGYGLALVLQGVFYGFAVSGHVLHRRGQEVPRLLNLPYNFVSQSFFRGSGVLRTLRGRSIARYTTVR